jgi:hypothetical protein
MDRRSDTPAPSDVSIARKTRSTLRGLLTDSDISTLLCLSAMLPDKFYDLHGHIKLSPNKPQSGI